MRNEKVRIVIQTGTLSHSLFLIPYFNKKATLLGVAFEKVYYTIF
jgi:hypothetical protein